MSIKCKLLAMEGDFTRAISQAVFPGGFVPKLLHFNGLCHPPTWGVRSCPESGCGESHQIGTDKRTTVYRTDQLSDGLKLARTGF